MTTLLLIAKQAAIFLGIPILIGGVVGNLLNTVVFISLKTFRENSCAFYLTIMSITNIGQLCFGFFSRIMISGFGIDWTQSSLIFCKLRIYIIQICALTSLACYCLATIDQYFATSSYPRWQQWCSIKIAQRLCMTSFIVFCLYAIPSLIYYNLIISATTRKPSCTITNPIFAKYQASVYQLLLLSSLPMFISGLFGLMAYINVRRSAYRTVPLVRRELDKQLTKMVLFQVIINFVFILPYFIVLTIPATDNINIQANVDYVNIFTNLAYYVYYANPFFIYICTSERFRRQLIYVLFEIYFNRWRQHRMVINQIEPQK